MADPRTPIEPAPPAEEPEQLPTHCAAHPNVETYLRCGRCETPICPRCLVQTPVGARCRSCARLRRLPVYDVRPRFLLRGAAAGLASALLGAVLLAFAPRLGLFLQLILGALYGAALAGAISLATNRKRGASLGWVAVAALILGWGLGRTGLFYLELGRLPEPVRVASALAAGFNPDLGSLLLLGVAGLIAYTRLR